jgi:RNA polymerase sigma factor (sigma-70 family)
VEGTPRTEGPAGVELLSQVLREVARRRLSPQDAQDFVQAAELRLLERGHDVLARFDGRSGLRTYLHVVAVRLLLDWRNAEYGKWRPSTRAVRGGAPAVLLDRLVWRDGCTPEEAVEIARTRFPDLSSATLRGIAATLPPHPPRRLVSTEVTESVRAADFEDPIDAIERAASARRRREALSGALRTLTAEERWLIRARFTERRTVQSIAQTLRMNPKQLYRRYERTLATLRRALEASGISGFGTTTSEA